MEDVTYVENNEPDEDPDISPPMRVPDVEREVQEFIRAPERAEPAIRAGVWICEVPSGTSNVWIHVLRACQTSRWTNGRVFNVRAGDLMSTEP